MTSSMTLATSPSSRERDDLCINAIRFLAVDMVPAKLNPVSNTADRKLRRRDPKEKQSKFVAFADNLLDPRRERFGRWQTYNR